MGRPQAAEIEMRKRRPGLERGDGRPPIDIEFAGGHRLHFENGRFSVSKEGRSLISDARASIAYRTQEEGADTYVKHAVGLEDEKSVVTPIENGIRIEIKGTESKPGMTTEILTGDDGLRIKQEINNTTGQDIRFDRFTGLDAIDNLGGVDPKKMWASAMGWTVWEPPIAGIVEDLPQTNQIAIRPHVNDIDKYDIVTKTTPDGVPILDAVALRDIDGDQDFFMGYLPRKGRAKHHSVIEPKNNGIEAWNDGEGVVIPAGEGRTSEELVIRFGQNAYKAREKFAEEYAERIGVVRSERSKPESGFVTWYDLFNNITPRDVPELIDATARLREEYGIDMSFFTLDDVHNPAMLETNAVPPGDPEKIEDFLQHAYGKGGEGYTYGDNVKAYAEHCKKMGLRPEVWMSPFIVSSGSDAFNKMTNNIDGMSTDMLLKDRDGNISVTHYHPEQDADFYALDLTNEMAQQFVREKIRFFTERGIKGLKFDFVYPAALQGQRTDATTTSLEAYNIGLKIAEEEVTDKGHSLLWGGQPIYETAGPWVGRIAPDSEAVTGINFDPLPHMVHLRRGKSGRNAGANSADRAAEGVHLYGDGIDVDPTPVAIKGELDESRIPTSSLTADQMRYLLAVGRGTGAHGRHAFGHDPRLATDEWIRRYRTVAETSGGVLKVLEVNREGYPTLLVRETGSGKEIIVFNMDLEPADIAVSRDVIGVPEGTIGQSIFVDRRVYSRNGHLVFERVAGQGAEVVSIAA